ncbi:MAG: FeoA family protein [Eggerthellaceae bacterium]
MVLSEVKKGGKYHVKQLRCYDETHRHLADLGFVPGEIITVVSRFGGNLVVKVKGSRVALSAELAQHVVV